MIKNYFIVITLLIFFAGCANTKVNMNPKLSDLGLFTQDSLEAYVGKFFKVPLEEREDFLVALVRSNFLNAHSTKNLGEILISLGTIKGEFDCQKFYSHLTDGQVNQVKDNMSDYGFVCENPLSNYTELNRPGFSRQPRCLNNTLFQILLAINFDCFHVFA